MLYLYKKGARALRERIRSALSKFHVGLGVQPSNKEGSFLLFGLAVHSFNDPSVSLLQRKSVAFACPVFYVTHIFPEGTMSIYISVCLI